MEIDWPGLRAAATSALRRAYAPYSGFPVGAAGLVDDGRVVTGCNVENASYGLTLCAECGLVSALHAGGGGRLRAVSCVDASGAPLMPCGRCRQLLWEHGGPRLLVDAVPVPRSLAELLPHPFDERDLAGAGHRDPAPPPGAVPTRLAAWRGRGTVFVHPDLAGGQPIWTGYWERAMPFAALDVEVGDDAGGAILEEGPVWATAAEAVAWGRARTPWVVVVDAEGESRWAGDADPPPGIPRRWTA